MSAASDRRPYVVAAVISAASLVVAAVAVARSGPAGPASRPTSRAMSRPASAPASQPTSRPTPPDGVALMDAARDVTLRGELHCGKCSLHLGAACNVVIWNRERGELVTVLPNDQLTALWEFGGT